MELEFIQVNLDGRSRNLDDFILPDPAYNAGFFRGLAVVLKKSDSSDGTYASGLYQKGNNSNRIFQ